VKQRQRPQNKVQPDVAVVGRIGSPYGVKGWLHLRSYTSPPENITSYLPLFTSAKGVGRDLPDDIEPDNDDWMLLDQVTVKPYRDGFIMKIGSVNDRDTARACTGSLVGTDPAAFAPPAEGEIYWRDLIGLRVENLKGEMLGIVAALTETGNHDVLVVENAVQGVDSGDPACLNAETLQADESNAAEVAKKNHPSANKKTKGIKEKMKQTLIPYADPYVLDVDLAAGWLRVDWDSDW